ncbi:C4-dicarboxylate ABC transporter substrate-binding protein [Bacillus taeanensis]|uniref:C4-dicarboxylate ABC transporter substrate-binding protein n=2 Tax=Bacillus taeanensis TaxID=273032 RepID=A0A366XS83_9BACI|nr:C4-dicarboxylate ABC transporter substrate-binding protein [Bacillus taeanensis]
MIWCLVLGLISACSSGASSEGGNTDGEAASGEQIVIKFGHGAAETNARHEAVLKFKELVEEKSNNQIKVDVFPNETLGSEPQMVESVAFNDLQMVAAGTYAQYHDKMGVFELPYLFETPEKAYEVLDGPIGQEVAEPLIDHNLRILAYFENGFRNITNNVKPIESPEDLSGIKLRTPEVPVSISTFKTFGANPTPMAFGELYMALQQGTVDGQENPLTNIAASKFQEVQKYLSLTGHQYSPLPVAISEEFWQTLSPELQEAVQQSAQEAAEYHRELVKANDEKLVEELKAGGMEVNTPEKAPFKELALEVYKEYEDIYGKELIEKLVEAGK